MQTLAGEAAAPLAVRLDPMPCVIAAVLFRKFSASKCPTTGNQQVKKDDNKYSLNNEFLRYCCVCLF